MGIYMYYRKLDKLKDIFLLIENHVITSVQEKVKSFRRDTSGLLQLSAVSVSSPAPCVVWVSRDDKSWLQTGEGGGGESVPASVSV